MNLAWYNDKQQNLNSVLQHQPSDEQLIAAIVAELGEFANSVKFGNQGWVWWPRPGAKGATRDEALGELIDILHFLLVGYGRKNEGAMVYHQTMIDEYKAAAVTPSEAMYDLPFQILKSARENRFHLAILSWYALARAYLFTDAELEDGFRKSIDKNLSRWVA